VIRAGVCWAFKVAAMNGLHQPEDDYRLALYASEADLGPETERYTAKGEATGLGYFARGKSLRGRKVVLDRGVAVLDFDDLTWEDASITAAGALLYNATKGGAALAVLILPEERESVNGPFTVRMPAASKESALVRFA